MRAEWRKYAARIDALSLRERVAVFVAFMAVIFYVGSAFLLDPVLARKKAVVTVMTQQRNEMQAIQTQIAALEAKQFDPDAANIARRNSMKDQIASIDATLKEMNQSLVPAQNMKALLQDMLSHQPRLQLVSMRTLPVTPLVEKPAKAEKGEGPSAEAVSKSAAGDGNVFKHGVEITLQGSYADLYDYLTRVEKLNWRMFWSRASLNAEDFPRLKLTVTIYTLSLDKAWLVV
jgi:MSHA biogenesis protein MshJ